ncbi:ATPase AAA [Spirochaetia bacterium]|nr:ATPase AAA [Spirochaetia bacterium]
MPNKNAASGSAAILAELDAEQKRAATAEFNAVVTAGAGSGKTKVLAARYAWLIMEKGYRVDEILTLTFTNKAVTEMYSRIYGLLAAQRENQRAREAIAEFHKAHIMTIDAFCAGVARTASARYGISPDFSSDNPAVRELAVEAALPFVLAHRDNPSLQVLMADRKIRAVAEELFAETVLQYSPISSPLNFDSFMQKQSEEIVKQWAAKTRAMADLVNGIIGEFKAITKTSGVLYTNLKEQLARPVPPIPDIAILLQSSADRSDSAAVQRNGADNRAVRQNTAAYFAWLHNLKSISLAGRHSDDFTIIKESLKEIKNRRYGELESLALIALQSDIAAAVFPLVDEFQQQFNRQKREAGLLTFNDIAHLAVDALTQYPDIRQVYKDNFKSIMVDEFQDNNSLQRDLIFLLAEDSNRTAVGLPGSEELSNNKMFFVGDEKQSIYRFRGADVSVFRSLAQTLTPGPAVPGSGGISGGSSLSLVHNYRSGPVLIAAFNRIFGGLLPDTSSAPGSVFLPAHEDAPNFEAAYNRVYAHTDPEPEDVQNPPVHFCFLDKGRVPKDDPQGLSYYDLEAAYIARQIRDMVDSGYEIPERRAEGIGSRPCTYQDFAILQRSYSHQSSLEKQCKNFGIPFNADRPAGLFNDAPVNDLHNFLRILVYPEDRIAYAALLRSPFMRLSDLALSVCLLSDSTTPFDEKLESSIPVDEQELYRRSRERYQALAEDARTLPVTNLLTKLWYDEGYRFETLWSAPAQIYGELFDLFFELAREIDGRGKGLADFLDYLEDLLRADEKLDDLSIPAEDAGGVRIMSIHKSKGLEFPVVFVYCCGSGGRHDVNTQAVYFSGQWGITINLPKAEELIEYGGNYFFNLQKEEEAQKRTAELRRLLYVAMTRAESRLFITASLPEQTKDEKADADPENSGYTVEFIQERLFRLKTKKEDSDTVSSFLDLLLPALIPLDGEQPPFSIEPIPVYSRAELAALSTQLRRQAGSHSASMEKAAATAVPQYASAERIATPEPRPLTIPASSLHYAVPGEAAAPGAAPPDAADNAARSESTGTGGASAIDRILEKADLEPAEFGTIVHAFLEGRFNNRKPIIPPKILARLSEKDFALVQAEAQAMTEQFFSSSLGKLSTSAVWREPEFPILTLVKTGDRPIPVTGQIDLLFESRDDPAKNGAVNNSITDNSPVGNSTLYVVDFKTDRVEEPDRHLGQLAVYERAIGDIFGKPVRSWLFYLRTGNTVELTERLREVIIEELYATDGARVFDS